LETSAAKGPGGVGQRVQWEVVEFFLPALERDVLDGGPELGFGEAGLFALGIGYPLLPPEPPSEQLLIERSFGDLAVTTFGSLQLVDGDVGNEAEHARVGGQAGQLADAIEERNAGVGLSIRAELVSQQAADSRAIERGQLDQTCAGGFGAAA